MAGNTSSGLPSAAEDPHLLRLLADHLTREAQAAPVAVSISLILVVVLIFQRRSATGGSDQKLKAKVRARNRADYQDEAVDDFLKKLGAPDEAHVEGTTVPPSGLIVNNTRPTHFENEMCTGTVFSLHRATHNKQLDRSGDYAFGDYFAGKKRLWEFRMQMTFKRVPLQSEMYFGIELEKYVPMGSGTKRTMEGIVTMLKRVVGNQVYHTPGDDPAVEIQGELEMPAFVMPLWAFDQYIVTPPGDRIPDLDDPDIENMGSKRVKRVKEFKQELDDMVFEVGGTYTFCFWGISQWLDKLNWQIKMPFMGSLDFNMFCGAPPVHMVMYTLAQDNDNRDKRHLQSKKNFYINVAFWSSIGRPSGDVVMDLLGDAAVLSGLPSNNGKSQAKGPAGANGSPWMACCSGR